MKLCKDDIQCANVSWITSIMRPNLAVDELWSNIYCVTCGDCNTIFLSNIGLTLSPYVMELKRIS